jgi:DNA-binding response OmpR family regulator
MAEIDLLIPDASLRAAVIEQLALAKLGKVGEVSDVAKAGNSLLMIDSEALDKKTLKALRDKSASDDTGSPVFVLGELAGENGDEAWLTESFPKPLRLGHLLARAQFYLQVAPRLRNTVLTFGPFAFQSQKRQIVKTENGKTDIIRLTEKETALLDYLAQSDKAVSREELLAAIWGYDARIDTHTLETHIYQLRRKLNGEADGGDQAGSKWLVNEQGSYRLARDQGAA